ncbi:hypothetical protein KAI78_09040 [bacterium]|nr:hypothetical protein [bacterium]
MENRNNKEENQHRSKIKILKDVPSKEDKIGIHQTISKTIIKIMDNKIPIEKHVIGLFGNWGSGKSTIIELVETERSNNVFIFNSWAHKDDYLYRVFLKNLYDFFPMEKESLEQNITRKIVKRHVTKNKDDISFSFITKFLMFLLLINVLGVSLFHLIFQNLNNFFHSSLVALAVSVISVGTLFLLAFLDDKNLKKISDLLLKGDYNITDTNETEQSEDFPSYVYKQLFLEILENIDGSSLDELVIVLDDLDRVDNGTIMRMISLLMLTIEGLKSYENEKFNNVWFVIPIDKERVKAVFSSIKNNSYVNESINGNDKQNLGQQLNHFEEEFIEKVFPYTIEIPDISQLNWRNIFKEKFEELFGKEKEKENILIRIFYLFLSDSKPITPREIINYLNEVSINYGLIRAISNESERMQKGNWLDVVLVGVYVGCQKYKCHLSFLDYLKKGKAGKDNDKQVKRIINYLNKVNYSNILLEKSYKILKYKTFDISDLLYKDKLISEIQALNENSAGDSNEIENILNKISIDKIEPYIRNIMDEVSDGEFDFYCKLYYLLFYFKDSISKKFSILFKREVGSLIIHTIEKQQQNLFIDQISGEGLIFLMNNQDLDQKRKKLILEKIMTELFKEDME